MKCAISAAVLLSALSVGLVTRSNAAVAYDAVGDWNPATNTAANVWQYGTTTTLAGPLTRFSLHGASASPSYDWWSTSGRFAGPVLAHNNSGGQIFYPGFPPDPDNILWPANELAIAPGGSGTGTPSYIVLRWVAPVTGTYDVSGRFSDLQRATADVFVLENGATLFSAGYSGSTAHQGDRAFPLSSLFVTQGSTIDFVAYSRGFQNDDVLGITATITAAAPGGGGGNAVPLPPAAWGVVPALVILGALTGSKRGACGPLI